MFFQNTFFFFFVRCFKHQGQHFQVLVVLVRSYNPDRTVRVTIPASLSQSRKGFHGAQHRLRAEQVSQSYWINKWGARVRKEQGNPYTAWQQRSPVQQEISWPSFLGSSYLVGEKVPDCELCRRGILSSSDNR